jgi:hypothetical protein
MIKCVDKGRWTCFSRTGVPKKTYTTDTQAIAAAKTVNTRDPRVGTKLVAYKCAHCHGYHLLTVNKRQRC